MATSAPSPFGSSAGVGVWLLPFGGVPLGWGVAVCRRAWWKQREVGGCRRSVVPYSSYCPIVWGEGSLSSCPATLCDELVDHDPEGCQVYFGGWGKVAHPLGGRLP